MATLELNGKTLNIVYIDPAKNGSGQTPATALKTFPSTFADNTAYVIRRSTTAVALPSDTHLSALNASIFLVGMPKATDEIYNKMPEEAKTAWGSDAAEYATVSWSKGYMEGGYDSPAAPVLKELFVYRCNITTAMTSSDYYYKTYWCYTTLMTSLMVNHCKFNRSDVKLEEFDGTSAIAIDATHAQNYFYGNATGCRISFNDTIFVEGVNGYTFYGASNTSRSFSVTNCTWHTPLSAGGDPYAGSGSGVYHKCTGDVRVINCTYHNYVVAGSTGAIKLGYKFYAGTSNDSYGCRTRNAVFKNITMDVHSKATNLVDIDKVPGMYYCKGTCFGCYAYSLEVDNITINMPYFGYEGDYVYGSGGNILIFASITQTGYSGQSSIQNITITCSTPGIMANGAIIKNGSCAFYNTSASNNSSRIKSGSCSLYLRCDSGNFASSMVAKNITINDLYGAAMYAYRCTVYNATIEGQVLADMYTNLDIDTLKIGFSSNALRVSKGNIIRVGKLECDTTHVAEDGVSSVENPISVDRDSPGSYPITAFINETNTPMVWDLVTSVASDSYPRHFVIANEGGQGNYNFHGENVYIQTWGTSRTGGSNVALKVVSNAQAKQTIELGNYPHTGFRVTPTETGVKTLTLYVALSNMTGKTPQGNIWGEIITTDADGKRSFTDVGLLGGWQSDDSEWSELGMDCYKLSTTIDVKTLNPIELKLYLALYNGGAGYYYIDPKLELI